MLGILLKELVFHTLRTLVQGMQGQCCNCEHTTALHNVEIFCLAEGITSVALCSQPSCPLLSLAFHLVREEPRPEPRPNCTLVIWQVGDSVG